MFGSPDNKLHISPLSLSDGQLNTEGGLVRRARLAVREREGSVRVLEGRKGRDSPRILGPARLSLEYLANLHLVSSQGIKPKILLKLSI